MTEQNCSEHWNAPPPSPGPIRSGRRHGCDGQWANIVVDYETGRRVSHSSMLIGEAYDLFALEVYRLLPTLALTPTTRPHRFATDSNEER